MQKMKLIIFKNLLDCLKIASSIKMEKKLKSSPLIKSHPILPNKTRGWVKESVFHVPTFLDRMEESVYREYTLESLPYRRRKILELLFGEEEEVGDRKWIRRFSQRRRDAPFGTEGVWNQQRGVNFGGRMHESN